MRLDSRIMQPSEFCDDCSLRFGVGCTTISYGERNLKFDVFLQTQTALGLTKIEALSMKEALSKILNN
jgi:hypothetical protein